MRQICTWLDNVMTKVEEALLASSILGLSLITIGNVLSRKLLNYSWSWAEEVLQFILVLVTFMGISYAARRSRHIRMTAFYEMLREPARKVLMLIISLGTALLLFYLSYYALLYVLKVHTSGRVTPALRIPFYLAVIWAPLGLFTGGVQYARTFIKNLCTEGVWTSAEMTTEYAEVDAYGAVIAQAPDISGEASGKAGTRADSPASDR